MSRRRVARLTGMAVVWCALSLILSLVPLATAQDTSPTEALTETPTATETETPTLPPPRAGDGNAD